MPPDSPRTARSKPACRSWPRMNSPMTRRATSVSMASSVGSSKAAGAVMAGGRPTRSRGRTASEPDRVWRLLPGRDVKSRLRERIAGQVTGEPRALVEDALELALLELQPLVAEQRQADPLAPDLGQRELGHEQALIEERRAEQRRPGRVDDLRAAPERDRLVHPDPVAEDDE